MTFTGRFLALGLTLCAASLGACETMSLGSEAPAPMPAVAAASVPAAPPPVFDAALAAEVASVTPIPSPRRRAKNAPSPSSQPEAAIPSSSKGSLARYAAYQKTAGELTRQSYPSAKSLNAATGKLNGFKPEELAEGWMLRNAAAAAGVATFRDGVKQAAEAEGREAFLQSIARNPERLRTLPGGEDAVKAVYTAIRVDVTALREMGATFRQTWLRMQRKASLEISRPVSAVCGSGALAIGGSVLPFEVGPQQKAALIDRTLALAAGSVLGASEGPQARFARDATVSQCVRFARLNLRQCLAAKHGAAEAAFCLDRHGAEEMAGCLEWVLPGVKTP
ncbi:MAG: hypothetical protein HXY22_11405 [Alphaproteobacteria bacterium]|nr:hypothetical protein [Alphaproteobacteria bacterium]